jgi:hypothetical protein
MRLKGLLRNAKMSLIVYIIIFLYKNGISHRAWMMLHRSCTKREIGRWGLSSIGQSLLLFRGSGRLPAPDPPGGYVILIEAIRDGS